MIYYNNVYVVKSTQVLMVLSCVMFVSSKKGLFGRLSMFNWGNPSGISKSMDLSCAISMKRVGPIKSASEHMMLQNMSNMDITVP
jgi:hypothetical protein